MSANSPIRTTMLALLLVLSTIGGVVAVGPADARETVRTKTTAAPAVLFMGEQSLNVTETYRAATGNVPGDTITLAGTAGQADGGIVSVDPTDVDVTAAAGFETGAYSVDGTDGTVHVNVRDPAVTSLSLYRGNDDTGAEITGGHLPTGENVTVTAEFTFAAAEYLEVSVVNENGVEITPEVVPERPAKINASGGSLTLDIVGAALEAGETYTVRVEGADLDQASRVTTFAIREADTTISLSKTSVTRGESVVGTVIGPPGGTVTVRIDAADVDGDATTETARTVFLFTGDVLSNAQAGNGQIGAVLELGDDGAAKVLIDTEPFQEENTATIEVADGGSSTAGEFANDAEDEVDLAVEERRIAITAIPNSVVIGEEFEIAGSAPEADSVKAYARIGDAWEPLYEDAGNELAVADTGTGGEFSVTVDSTAVINLLDTYRVGIVASPGSSIEPTETISDTTFAEQVTDTETLAAQKGTLRVSLSSHTIAADVGDDVVLTGRALGQGSSVRAYVVGPRGEVYPTAAGEVIDVEENRIEHEFAVFDRRGTYTVIVVGRGRDGQYAHASRDPGTKATGTPDQNIAIIHEHYTGAGVDDVLIQRQVVARNPSMELSRIGTNGQVTPGDLTVSGTSNREDGTAIFVEVFDADRDIVASGDASVNGSTNRWSTRLDLDDLATGNYTVRASDNQVTAEQRIRLVEEVTTPTPRPTTPAETPIGDGPSPTPQVVTVRDVEIETEVVTRVVTPEETETPTGQPGFEAVLAVVAILTAALLGVRRRRGR